MRVFQLRGGICWKWIVLRRDLPLGFGMWIDFPHWYGHFIFTATCVMLPCSKTKQNLQLKSKCTTKLLVKLHCTPFLRALISFVVCDVAGVTGFLGYKNKCIF